MQHLEVTYWSCIKPCSMLRSRIGHVLSHAACWGHVLVMYKAMQHVEVTYWSCIKPCSMLRAYLWHANTRTYYSFMCSNPWMNLCSLASDVLKIVRRYGSQQAIWLATGYAARNRRYGSQQVMQLATGDTARNRRYGSQQAIQLATGDTARDRRYGSQQAIRLATDDTARNRRYGSQQAIRLGTLFKITVFIEINLNMFDEYFSISQKMQEIKSTNS